MNEESLRQSQRDLPKQVDPNLDSHETEWNASQSRRTTETTHPIAIVGMACRFPGAPNLQSFWQQLMLGANCVSECPAGMREGRVGELYTDTSAIPSACRFGAFLDDIDQFDADFFRISPPEAEFLDPQQRMMLETSWRALENANIDPESLRGSSASVYAGMSNNDYRYLILGGADTSQPSSSLYTITGTSLNTAIGRVSYALGFEGPAMTVDTACSSSLVAMHEAANALQAGESDLALAGGVQLVLSGKLTELRANAGMLSPDGTCKTFDAAANGYVRGEGCGIVAMKRLADAERDGDPIWAIVAATAINQDGTSDGLTVPRETAQRAVIEAALKTAHIRAADVDYLEAHGTGTPVGDPIEINAAAAVYGSERETERPLLIGSVKTNFGHLEPAAGVAGVIKTALAMKFGVIPKHLNFSNPSPEIDWDRLPVHVTEQATPWPEKEMTARFAGINSFGFSGTNAHVILQGYGRRVDVERTAKDLKQIAGEPKQIAHAIDAKSKQLTRHDIVTNRTHRIVPISAKSPEALMGVANTYREWWDEILHAEDDAKLDVASDLFSDFAWTASVARSHFNHRRALVVDHAQSLVDQLSTVEAVEPRTAPQKIAFAYTGQGSQWVGMGKALYESEPVFQRVIDRCEEVIQSERQASLIDRMFGLNGALKNLEDPAWVQPCIYALECGLTDLWESFGVRPHVVFGHSLGEIAAARTAGVFTLEDGCRYASGRGRLMSQLPGPGLMAAVFLSEEEIYHEVKSHNKTIDGVGVSVAALNGGHQVVSGYLQEVEPLLERLEADEIRVRRLPKSPAYHSALVDSILDDLSALVSELDVNQASLRLVSNLTGELIGEDDRLDGNYWRQHARQSVAYRQGVESIAALGVDAVLEIGPNAILGSMTQMCWPESSNQMPAVLASLRMPRQDRPEIPEDGGFLQSVAEAYEQGLAFSFEQLYAGESRRKIDLPGYPFQRRRFWVETRKRRRSQDDHQLLGSKHETPYGDLMYTTEFSASEPKWLNEHRVFGQVLVPGAVYGTMGVSCLDSSAGACLQDLQLHSPMVFKHSDDEEESRTVQLVLKPTAEDATQTFEIYSRIAEEEDWVLHASGNVGTQLDALEDTSPADINELISKLDDQDVAAYYKQKAETNIQLGTPFRNIKKLWSGNGEAVAEISVREDDALPGIDLQPLLLDACFQVLSAARETTNVGEGTTYIPFGWERLSIARTCPPTVICHARMQESSADDLASTAEAPEALSGDLWIYDTNGRMLGQLLSLTVKRATRASLLSSIEDPTDLLYETVWRVDEHPSLVRSEHPLPLLADLKENVDPFFNYLRAQGVNPDERYALLLDLERLAHAWIVSAFDKAGIERKRGTQIYADELMAQLGILPSHKRLVERILRMMTEAGVLVKTEEVGYEVLLDSEQPSPNALDEPEELFAELQHKHPHGLYELTLLSRFGRNLMDLLIGEADPLTLLFDEESSGAADFYKTAPVSVAGNRLLGDVITRLVRDLPSDRTLRVIEVGAGTGATTEIVFAELAATRLAYTYTDISAGFFSEAERNFEGNGIDIEYRVLDIEEDPLSQGYEDGYYDIVIAANVLHATRNLHETLSHCKQLLAPGGVLIALESLRGRAWQDLTFGFLDGWWRFNDQYRKDHAIASPDIWRQALADAGFATSHVFGDDTVSETSGPLGSGTVVGQLSKEIHMRPGTWLLESDGGELGSRLTEVLRKCQQQVIVSGFSTNRQSINGDQDVIGHDELPDTLANLSADAPLRGVIHLSSLDGHGVDATTQEIAADIQHAVASALSLTQILIECGATPTNGTWYVTRGAQILDHETKGQLAGSTLWGFGKVVELESSLLTPHMLDLDPECDTFNALVAEILAPDKESHIAYRQGSRYIARLVKEEHTAKIQLPEDPNWIMASGQDGSLQNIRAVPLQKGELAPREVRVKVEATGLNFSDVLVALGAQVPNASLGLEFAGSISELGEEVSEFAVGQRVLGMGFGTFGPEIVTHADLVADAPPNMTFHELATIPIVFTTTAISFELANLEAGDRVLIHSASGGVGLAAIQWVRAAGAEIYATASESKQAFLHSLGIEHVYDSRSLDFGERILEDTNGAGVDIVLNSLTGEGFIETSLSCLAQDGHFIEIGRLGILTPEEMDEARPDVTYHVVSLDELKREEPEQVGVTFRALVDRFRAGELRALRHAKWPMAEIADALQYMGSARHIGKLTLTMPPLVQGSLASDRTYLITGGFGGIGCEVANWLAERGAKHIVLNGRREPDEAASANIQTLRERGLNIELKVADVTDLPKLDAMMSAIDATMPPLGGLVHSVGVLSDGAITNLTWERFTQVLWPKVLGAWRLHEITKSLDLEFFVLFSSATGVLGNAGQANHAAANAFLDQLAAHRRSLGLAGQSIAWGAWSEIGEAAEQRERIASQLETTGTGWIAPELGIRTLDYLVSQDLKNPAAMSVDWSVLEQHLNARPMFLNDMFLTDEEDENSQSSSLNIDVAELRGSNKEQRVETLTLYIQNQLQAILRLPSLPSTTVGFFDLGMDSLMAVELRNRLIRAFEGELTISRTVVFDFPNVESLATHFALELDDEPSGESAMNADANPFTSAVRNQEIAVIGMACRFPGAMNYEDYWRNLEQRVDAIQPHRGGDDRWRGVVGDKDAPDDYVRCGAFVEGIDAFDAKFFDIRPIEARAIDPRQRFLLETCWEALENAAIDPNSLRGARVGVYVGLGSSEYRDLVNANGMDDSYLGTSSSMTTGRIAYAFGLMGSAMSFDLACASSLVAIHEGLKALQNGEVELAIVGGANAILSTAIMRFHREIGLLSTDGKCIPFDEKASGYIRGEGCGLLVLKRLDTAEVDGNPIWATIAGSAVNQSGASAGLTIPNGSAQEQVMRDAVTRAGIDPSHVDYLEAHATGLALGDPIELGATSSVYGSTAERENALLIGSVKGNIGHLEWAAGIAGAIKVILSMSRQKIPAQLHLDTPNQQVDWHDLQIDVNKEATEWPNHDRNPMGAVSAFGMSGTNAHVVFAGYDQQPTDDAAKLALPQASGNPVKVNFNSSQTMSDFDYSVLEVDSSNRSYRFLPLSAKSPQAVVNLAQKYKQWLTQSQIAELDEQAIKEFLADFTWTACIGRSHFTYRQGVVFSDLESLLDGLTEIAANPAKVAESDASQATNLAFLISGDIDDWLEFAVAMYAEEPFLKAMLDHCSEIHATSENASLIDVLANIDNSDLQSKNDPAANAVTFAAQLAIATFFESAGLLPQVIAGTNMGLLVASYMSGAISLESGLAAAQKFGSQDEWGVDDTQNDELRFPVMDANVGQLACNRAELQELFKTAQSRDGKSSEDSLAILRDQGVKSVLEIAPASYRQTDGNSDEENPSQSTLARICLLTPPHTAGSHGDLLANAIRRAYLAGMPIEFHSLFFGETRRKITLPSYAFERKRFWFND